MIDLVLKFEPSDKALSEALLKEASLDPDRFGSKAALPDGQEIIACINDDNSERLIEFHATHSGFGRVRIEHAGISIDASSAEALRMCIAALLAI